MKLALEPCLANALLRSAEHGCTEEMMIIVALISVDYAKVFYKPWKESSLMAAELKWRELTSDVGDHLTLLNVYRKWTVDGGSGWQWCENNFIHYQTMVNAKKLVDQIGGQLTSMGVPRKSCRSQYERVQAALAASFADKAACHYGQGAYVWLADKSRRFEQKVRVKASTESGLQLRPRPRFLVICYKVVVSGSKENREMQLVTEVDKDMLPESVRTKLPADKPWTPGDELQRAWLASQNASTARASTRRAFSLAYDNEW